MEPKLKAIVLAAGKGTRLQENGEDAPKVMRQIGGKPMLWYVLDALKFIAKSDVIIVVGYKKEVITDRFAGYIFAEQIEQLGTGHAVMAAQTELAGYNGAVLVCYGDMPLVKQDTYESLICTHFKQDNDCTILTGESRLRLPYGRIVRDTAGRFVKVVEEKDCSPDELKITELNTGVYVFRAPMLLKALGEIKTDNAQGEYYITDAPAIMLAGGAKIALFNRAADDEIIGVNTPEQLAMAAAILDPAQTTGD